ncbi:MlaD family protein [Herminiimonas glaciei]|uniref:MlaD family protein n=1 Tax=Herminiimonas glaciei TaxID=523788 RepID=A0ABW2IDP4_9BURK
MENKAHALMAGIFTIVLLIAAVLIALWFNRDRVERVPYEIATTLSVPGLNPQAGVRYRGLDVGRVDAVLFDPQKPGQILIRFSVSKDTPITQSTFATLSYQGVTGLAYVQLDDDGSQPVLLPSSKNKVARITLRASLLDTLQLRGLAILKQTEELASKVNLMLSDENQKTILGAFSDVSAAANKIEKIPQQLQPTLDKLPALANKADSALNSINRFSDEATQITSKLNAAGGPIDSLDDTINKVGSAASLVEYQASPLIDETRTSMRSLNRALESFNQRPQGILFGPGRAQPGPGEAGFSAPAP